MTRLGALGRIAGGKERAAEWVWLIAHYGYEFLINKELTVSWFLYHELDVMLLQILTVLLIAAVLYGLLALIRWCCRCCCGRRGKVTATPDTKKQQ